jgi:hypothetical protein
MTDQARRARIDELLGDRALEGLDANEQAELRKLLEEEGVNDDVGYELAAASLDLATLGNLEAPPRALIEKLHADAERHFAVKPAARDATGVTALASRKRSKFGTVAPWALAAAFLLLAVGGWWRELSERAGRGVSPVNVNTAGTALVPCPSTSGSATPHEKSAVERREELLAEAEDVQTLKFAATKDPGGEGASGDVVWSSTRQVGFMRFHGLRPNDRALSQYQLWIFDADRDDKYPVDGGVFDIDATTGDVVVPITPKVYAARPKLFAITVEKPGGVVVSKREHIVLAAAI